MSRSAEAWRSARSNSTGKPFFLYEINSEKVSQVVDDSSQCLVKNLIKTFVGGEIEREREL